MSELKIITWNIQNLGVTKAGMKVPSSQFQSIAQRKGKSPEYYRSDFILKEIANIIVQGDYDIICIIELNTTSASTAIDIIGRLVYFINTPTFASATPNNYKYILSPNTGREFYAFIIKDTTRTIPLTLSGLLNDVISPVIMDASGVKRNSMEGELTFSPATESTSLGENPSGASSSSGGAEYDYYKNYFPLIKPDRMRSHYVAEWHTRYPCLALFQVGNEVFSILSMHLSPDSFFASKGLLDLEFFSLVYDPSEVKFNISPSQQNNTNAVIITGDFNLHYSSTDIHETYQTFLDHGYNILNHENTLLKATPLSYHDKPKTTKGLRSMCIDNFIVKSVPNLNPGNTIQFATGGVIDIPEYILKNKPKFKKNLSYNWLTKQQNINRNVFESETKRIFTKYLAGTLSKTDTDFIKRGVPEICRSREATSLLSSEKRFIKTFISTSTRSHKYQESRLKKFQEIGLEQRRKRFQEISEARLRYMKTSDSINIRLIGLLSELIDCLDMSRFISDHLPVWMNIKFNEPMDDTPDDPMDIDPSDQEVDL